jgi:hypothetical protein
MGKFGGYLSFATVSVLGGGSQTRPLRQMSSQPPSIFIIRWQLPRLIRPGIIRWGFSVNALASHGVLRLNPAKGVTIEVFNGVVILREVILIPLQ